MFAKKLLYLSNIHPIWTHFRMMFVRLHLVTSNFHGNRMNIFLPFRSWKLYGISKILTIHCYKKLHPFWCSKNALTNIVVMVGNYIDVVFIYMPKVQFLYLKNLENRVTIYILILPKLVHSDEMSNAKMGVCI